MGYIACSYKLCMGLTHSVNVPAMVTAPQVLLQLASGPDKVAPAVLPRTVDVTARTAVFQVHFQRASGHGLITVGVVRTHHRQFVQNFPHQQTRRLYIFVANGLSVCRAHFLHSQVTFQATVTKGVPAWRVHGVYKRLQAYSAQQIFVHVIWVIVEVVLAWFMTLAATFTHDDVPHPLYLETIGPLGATQPLRSLRHLDESGRCSLLYLSLQISSRCCVYCTILEF